SHAGPEPSPCQRPCAASARIVANPTRDVGRAVDPCILAISDHRLGGDLGFDVWLARCLAAWRCLGAGGFGWRRAAWLLDLWGLAPPAADAGRSAGARRCHFARPTLAGFDGSPSDWHRRSCLRGGLAGAFGPHG